MREEEIRSRFKTKYDSEYEKKREAHFSTPDTKRTNLADPNSTVRKGTTLAASYAIDDNLQYDDYGSDNLLEEGDDNSQQEWKIESPMAKRYRLDLSNNSDFKNLDTNYTNINNISLEKETEYYLPGAYAAFCRPGASSTADAEVPLSRRSKHYSVKVQGAGAGTWKWKRIKRSNPYSATDYYLNSFYFARDKIEKFDRMRCNAPSKNPSQKRLRYRGWRSLKRLILNQLTKGHDDQIIHPSYWGDDVEANKDCSIILDSGTTTHIARDKDDFKAISNERVRIRGVTGVSVGFKGILKENELGNSIPAIYFKDLPVRMLLSAVALKYSGWHTELGNPQYGDRSTDLRTGDIVPIVIINGLTCYDLHFIEEGSKDEATRYKSGLAAQTVESEQEWCQECHYLDEEVTGTGDIRGAVKDTQDRPKSGCSKRKKPERKISRLLEHQRMCHMFTDASARCRCFDCLEFKGRKSSHDKERDDIHKINNAFVLFSCDFFGPVKPKSFKGNNWCLLFCCDKCNYTKAQSIEHKSEAPFELIKFVNEVRRKCGCETGSKETPDGKLCFAGIHCDNEPVFRGDLWKQAIQKTKLTELHSVPYCPQMNGTCERHVGTIKSSLRTTMNNVDPRVWDFCLDHISQVYNMKNSKKATLCAKKGTPVPCCPDDIMQQESKNPFFRSGKNKIKHLRRFGCLAYFKRDVGLLGKQHLDSTTLAPRRVKGIHLGFSSKNSSWLIGTINGEGRLAVYETIDVVFVESVLVRDIRLLCHKDISIPVVDTDGKLLGLPSLITEPRHPQETGQSGGDSSSVGNLGRERALNRVGREKEIPEMGEILFGEYPKEDDLDSIQIGQESSDTEKTVSLGEPLPEKDRAKGDCTVVSPPCDLVGEIILKDEPAKKRGRGRPKKTMDEALEGAKFGPPIPMKKRRGRPAGTKDRTKRKRRTGKQINQDKIDNCFWQREDTKRCFNQNTLPDEFSHLAMDEDDEEGTMEFEIFLAKVPTGKSKKPKVKTFLPSKPGDFVKPSWAFDPENPECHSWIEAKDKEGATILAYESWRRLDKNEEKDWREGRLKAVPCALLLNRKRCGRYKARLVVLGNRWHPDEDNSVYASVVSQTGNRAVMTHCAKQGFHVTPFDISNAFIRAEMGDLKVAVKLPEAFREGPDDDGVRMLLKALYGLPISPRLWAKTLARDLNQLGWEECKSEPGVYRKFDKKTKEVVAYITVYVDDCIVGAKTRQMCDKEVKLINDVHPLKIIETKVDNDGTMNFDMCGADIAYNAGKHTLKISMSNYIDKVLERFKMEDCKPRPIPGFPEENLYAKSKPCDFKFRAAVGALQWLATTARPDIAHSTNMLARAGSLPVTRSMRKCATMVFKYLAGTKQIGLEYSPEIEDDFNQVYGELTEHEDNKRMPADQLKKPVTLFTDASFGVVYKTLRSITGVMVYLHGMPIAWKTKVQTLHTSSTTESEWVALADGIEFSQSVYGLQRFLVGRNEIEDNEGSILCDNRCAVINGRKGPEGLEEIPKKTRHIALRYARVLEHGSRIWFVPTDKQLADGMTKSNHRNPLLQIFSRHPERNDNVKYTEEEMEQDLDFSDCYHCMERRDIESFESYLVYNKVSDQSNNWFS